jgi:hypothetical protein
MIVQPIMDVSEALRQFICLLIGNPTARAHDGAGERMGELHYSLIDTRRGPSWTRCEIVK